MLGRSQGTWGESPIGDTQHATFARQRRKPSVPPRTSMTAANRRFLRFDPWTDCLSAVVVLVLMFELSACTTYHVADAGSDAPRPETQGHRRRTVPPPSIARPIGP